VVINAPPQRPEGEAGEGQPETGFSGTHPYPLENEWLF